MVGRRSFPLGFRSILRGDLLVLEGLVEEVIFYFHSESWGQILRSSWLIDFFFEMQLKPPPTSFKLWIHGDRDEVGWDVFLFGLVVVIFFVACLLDVGMAVGLIQFFFFEKRQRFLVEESADYEEVPKKWPENSPNNLVLGSHDVPWHSPRNFPWRPNQLTDRRGAWLKM